MAVVGASNSPTGSVATMSSNCCAHSSWTSIAKPSGRYVSKSSGVYFGRFNRASVSVSTTDKNLRGEGQRFQSRAQQENPLTRVWIMGGLRTVKCSWIFDLPELR